MCINYLSLHSCVLSLHDLHVGAPLSFNIVYVQPVRRELESLPVQNLLPSSEHLNMDRYVHNFNFEGLRGIFVLGGEKLRQGRSLRHQTSRGGGGGGVRGFSCKGGKLVHTLAKIAICYCILHSGY